jgi:hypothetical protein
MMQSYLWQMVCTRATEEAALDILEGSAGCGCGQALSVSLEQLLMMQNELMRMLMKNEAHRGVGHPQHP